jgi:hypothetical protein
MRIIYMNMHIGLIESGKEGGEKFREQVLVPLLRSNCQVAIDLDKCVESYSAAFLQEAFGGIITYGYFTYDELRHKITFKTDDVDFYFYIQKILEYMNKADYRSAEYDLSCNNTSHWIVKTACGYKILAHTGEYVIFFTHASHVKSYFYSNRKAYEIINSKTDLNTVKRYELATNEKWFDPASDCCF